MERKNISSGSEFEAAIGYSRAVVTGSWIMVSGTTGYASSNEVGKLHNLLPKIDFNRVDHATGTISPSVVEQTEQALRTVEAALAEAGATLRDVVRVRYILPNKKDFPLIWPVLSRVFGDVRPAATMIQAELINDDMKVEIEVTARKTTDELEGTI